MSGCIQVQKLCKTFKSYNSEMQRFASWFGLRVRARDEHTVINNISFSVNPGEAVGIIGQNGAGKSTLLKLITGTLRPTAGSVSIQGHVAAILELGMGFHPELTGRQNLLQAGGLMGFSQRELAGVMDEMEAFAEIGDFFEQPVRTYSSGMQMRLAFSLATAFRPDVLIIDEALSVGDTYFRHKSIDRIRKYKDQGTTLLFVSHDPGAVKTLCNRALLLEEGILIKDGAPDSILDYYNAVIARKEKEMEIRQYETLQGKLSTRSGNAKAQFVGVEILDMSGKQARAFRVGDEAVIRCKIRYNEDIENATVGIKLRDRLGNDVFGTNTFHLQHNISSLQGEVWVDFSLILNLGYGNYSVTVASHTIDMHIEDSHDWWDQAAVFQIVPGDNYPFVGVSYLPAVVSSRIHEIN